MVSDSLALVVVGMAGAGKSTVTEYFKNRGLRALRFGQLTIDEVSRRGLPLSEETERMVREELRQAGGMDAYARLLWPNIQQMLRGGSVVLDGLYSWSEYRFLRTLLRDRLMVLAVVAARWIRYKRLEVRSARPLSLAEAEARDIAEIENLEKGGPIAIADFTVLNDGSKEELVRRLDEIWHYLGFVGGP